MSSTHLAFLRNLLSPTRGGRPRRREVKRDRRLELNRVGLFDMSETQPCDQPKLENSDSFKIRSEISNQNGNNHTMRSKIAFQKREDSVRVLTSVSLH
jgi:hypothetical protein